MSRYVFEGSDIKIVKTGKNRGIFCQRLKFRDNEDPYTPEVSTRPFIELKFADISQHLKNSSFKFEKEIGKILAKS